MKKFSLFAGAALAASIVVAAPALAASPVEGKWAIEAKTDFGTFKSTMTVAESGGATTVEMADVPTEGMPPPGPSKISDVKVDGNTLTFKREISFGDMPIALDYTATVDGNTLTGTANSSFGATPITGTRE
jgi:hypothetical protein